MEAWQINARVNKKHKKRIHEMKFLCVYCGASQEAAPIYKNAAIELGALIGKNGYGLVYGGGRLGLMGLVADAAIDNGGVAVGYTTEHLDEREGAHPNLSELYVVDTMHTRKMRMSQKGDMFVILPGGFGTLDELFEIITWRQINLHHKPIVVVNVDGYWDPLKNLMDEIIDRKFAKQEHRTLVKFVSTPQEVIDYANGEAF